MIRSVASRAAAAALLGAFLAGCGTSNVPSKEVLDQIPLQEVGQIYRSFSADKNKPPTKVADLKVYEPMCPAGYNAVKSGKVEVLWDAKLEDLSDEGGKDAADEVLAFEKKVPTEGGLVLMKNREVKAMTADEFKAAKKAGKSAPGPDKKG